MTLSLNREVATVVTIHSSSESHLEEASTAGTNTGGTSTGGTSTGGTSTGGTSTGGTSTLSKYLYYIYII
jgi:hypothetical protein